MAAQEDLYMKFGKQIVETFAESSLKHTSTVENYVLQLVLQVLLLVRA